MRILRSRLVKAFGLIELLVVAAILVVLAVYLLPHYLGGRTADGKKIKSPITVTKDVVCRTNLGSVRQVLEAAKASDPDGALPKDLMELRQLSAELRQCPVGGERYTIDLTTGAVRCPHPGHERY